ncbi:Cytochrome p450, partial [Thalictrum thalictroides]
MVFNEDLTCLGGDGTPCNEKFLHAFKDVATLSAGRYLYALPLLWRLERFLNIGGEKRLRESIKIVHEFIENIIKCRIQDNESGREVDLLSRFIAASDENLENSLQFLRDFCIGFILAGRDTYTVLVWFYWLLSSRPEIERNILEEIKAIRNSNGKCIGDNYDLAELRQMHYLHAAISEAMRLYPTPTINTKVSQEEDIMPDGTFVGKGWFVAYTAYGMGRMENLWGKDCNDFVPERWLDNGMFKPESPYKYSAFHGGPRMCLGKDLAYVQMKLIAASMIEKFKIEVVDKAMCPEHL